MITLIGAIIGLILGYRMSKTQTTSKVLLLGGGALVGAIIGKFTSGLITFILFAIIIALIIKTLKK